MQETPIFKILLENREQVYNFSAFHELSISHTPKPDEGFTKHEN